MCQRHGSILACSPGLGRWHRNPHAPKGDRRICFCGDAVPWSLLLVTRRHSPDAGSCSWPSISSTAALWSSLMTLLSLWVQTSLTHWLTPSRLVDLIDVTLACKDANWKLVADVDAEPAEDRVSNSLFQIWELSFGHKAIFFSEFKGKVWSRFWSSGKICMLILLLMFCRGYEVEYWLRFWR